MQAAVLPFAAGWRWIQDGLGLFTRQPLAMFFWSLVTGLLITISYLIPLFGQMALIASVPLLTFITLNACRHIAHGRSMQPGMWLEPLRDTERRKNLLRLGFTYLGACLLGGLLATLPFMGELMQAVGTEGQVDEAALIAAIRKPFLAFAIIYLLISGLFWHAPALVGWHRIRLGQALFYSMVACWRNKWPFLLYGISWAAIFVGVQTLGDILAAMGLGSSLTQLVLTPINIAVAAILYCSFYPTYVSVFGHGADTDQPEDTRPA